uniref:LIM and calponin homology domains-containing protein 1-like n=1 Tax=Nothobranchius furzeri TaxID=105023 RepID=A0A8C6MJB4_NOTFU
MASPACGNSPGAPPREQKPMEPSHPEPAACQEAQKWVEAVTGKSFGDKDFRSALENGILLCELLTAIKPGLVKKINRLPTPIAGLDNLSVFLRGCEELGLKGSQLFDPGDLQNTSICANLKDSDCNRKLKNVLNTVFWLGKAASGCPSYSGPTLNLKEFEGLLAQMKVENEDGADSPQQRSVRDSGYDCWDSERSESLSPPRHTRDNSLDSLDSFGSRSQHSPSPDVVNRVIGDGRGSDSEADASNRKPDVRKDDMLARRTAKSESRCSIPFNQFLPNRTNASSYVPAPRRKQHTEEVEQRSHPQATQEQGKRVGPHHKTPKTVSWAPENNRNKVKQVEDVGGSERRRMQKLEKAGIKVLPAAVRYISLVTVAAEHQAPPSQVPTSPTCSGLRARKEGEEQEKGDVMNVPDPAASGVTKLPPTPSLVPPPPSPPPAQLCGVHMEKVDVKPEKKPFWLENNLPPMMVSRRVAFQLDNESVSMGDMGNDEELGHLPSLSRYERMHEQYNSFREDEDHWQDDLARWKTRRRSASQELIKKEEERKQMEKRMKDEEGDSNKRKNIKTYKEIVEEKERREAELCEAYRNAATPEEAALVLQRYALRFTISDATLDSLKLPRSTAKTKQEQNREEEEERKLTSPVSDAEKQEHLHKPNSAVATNQRQTQPEYIETDVISEQEKSRAIPNHSPAPNGSVLTETNTQDVPLGLGQLQKLPTESPPAHQEQLITEEAQPQTKDAPPQNVQTVSLHPPSPVPSRPLPLLVAKPFCQPRSTFSGHKPIKVDGLVQVKGEATEDFPSLLVSLQENKDVSSKQTEEDVCPEPAEEKTNTTEQPAPPQTEKSASFTGSAISSLIGGRNCIVTTTIVTELTQTHMEPLHPEIQSKGPDGTAADQESALPAESPSSIEDYSPTITENVEESSVSIETPMLNLAKRVNHWVWDPNEERKRLEMWQQEHEHLLQEQYEKEQEKLKKEWEKAQQEVEEEERKHNEEERRILEETVAPLSPSGLLQSEHTRTAFSENNNKTAGGTVTPQQNGRKILTGNEDQHSSKLHFFQDSSCDGESSKKQELWKTASLDRNPQLNQSQSVKRSGSHDAVTSNQPSSPPTPQPPSPSRCVSGRRLCSGCSKPLGKGAAMIIDTLGLFFHVQCFKCGACNGQLGDATTGTDVRIRNGQLSCYECYIASRGRGQPTTL